ncbi:protein phosphatase 1 regulatory subunit 36 [Ictalurus furcatus]|uniref:protein phosphatase 1 regulatory subunit 36 n=1 Tax=Ictalurus furcatus TaxID=66913 RepID=UPI0023502580|nr:protein phosphatase 1 regulatory subunit 36 [Ictalurus furcatus]
MAKLEKETVSVPPPGKWTWNDETQTLEFTCFNISAGIKKKRKASKTSSYQELVREHLVKISQCKSSAKGRSSGLRKHVRSAELDTHKAAAECSQGDLITIEDIKQVAVSLMQEKDALPIPLCFWTVIKSKELDEFLAALLLYLHCYWRRKALEDRSKPLMVEQSVTEQQMTAEESVKLELAKKHLAVCYSSLVLGQGLSQQHHMACGRSRVSSTYRDRHLYECLYSFFCYVAWITFGRRDLKGIQTEIGRLLRPDTFNPALRAQRNEPEEEEEEQEITQEESQPETIPSIRKSRHRLGLVSMLTQCSPVMMSILPSTREKASNLFQSPSLHKQQPDKLIDTDVLMKELSQQLASCRFGILGEPLSQLRHTIMMPHGAKKEEEDADDEDHVDDDDDDDDENDNLLRNNMGRKTTFMHQRSATTTAEKRRSLSRAHTVTSRATTEAPLSDTE